jgi:hypothetical protein
MNIVKHFNKRLIDNTRKWHTQEFCSGGGGFEHPKHTPRYATAIRNAII